MNIRTEESAPSAPAPASARDAGQSLPRDARAVPILAKTIYRELKQSGLSEEEVMGVAGELLAQVTSDLRAKRPSSPPARQAP